MWYKEEYLGKLIHVIRDWSSPTQCYFHAGDVATVLTSLNKQGMAVEFDRPELALTNIMMVYPRAFNGSYIRTTSPNDPLTLDFYLDLNGIVLFFLLVKAPNWHFYYWARMTEEKITSKWKNFLCSQTKNEREGILAKLWAFLSFLPKKVI